MLPHREALTALLHRQEGLLSRAQARAYGVTDGRIEGQLRARRWQRVHAGVWGAVLACGAGAMASHDTAAELDGVLDPEPAAGRTLHITVPSSRRVVAPAGVRLHYAERAAARRHPTCSPPRTRVEETVLDLWSERRGVESALGLVAAACQRRRTTAARLLAAAAARKKLPRRRLLCKALQDVAGGAHSALELRYLNDVERAHGLPRGRRQVRVTLGRPEWADVCYDPYATLVELDGWRWHRERTNADRRRDNAHEVEGWITLRYGWEDAARSPCATAAQVGAVFTRRGWTGRLRRCGPSCTAA